MRCKKKSWRDSKRGRQTSMTRGYRSWSQDLINVWTVPGTMLKNKVTYRQFIHSVAFVNLKCCTCLRPLYLYFPDKPLKNSVTFSLTANFSDLFDKLFYFSTLSLPRQSEYAHSISMCSAQQLSKRACHVTAPWFYYKMKLKKGRCNL